MWLADHAADVSLLPIGLVALLHRQHGLGLRQWTARVGAQLCLAHPASQGVAHLQPSRLLHPQPAPAPACALLPGHHPQDLDHGLLQRQRRPRQRAPGVRNPASSLTNDTTCVRQRCLLQQPSERQAAVDRVVGGILWSLKWTWDSFCGTGPMDAWFYQPPTSLNTESFFDDKILSGRAMHLQTRAPCGGKTPLVSTLPPLDLH